MLALHPISKLTSFGELSCVFLGVAVVVVVEESLIKSYEPAAVSQAIPFGFDETSLPV